MTKPLITCYLRGAPLHYHLPRTTGFSKSKEVSFHSFELVCLRPLSLAYLTKYPTSNTINKSAAGCRWVVGREAPGRGTGDGGTEGRQWQSTSLQPHPHPSHSARGHPTRHTHYNTASTRPGHGELTCMTLYVLSILTVYIYLTRLTYILYPF